MRGAFNHFISGFLILALLTGSYLSPVNGSQNSLPPEANQIIFALFESLNTGDEYEDLRRIAAIKANKNQTTFHSLLKICEKCSLQVKWQKP